MANRERKPLPDDEINDQPRVVQLPPQPQSLRPEPASGQDEVPSAASFKMTPIEDEFDEDEYPERRRNFKPLIGGLIGVGALAAIAFTYMHFFGAKTPDATPAQDPKPAASAKSDTKTATKAGSTDKKGTGSHGTGNKAHTDKALDTKKAPVSDEVEGVRGSHSKIDLGEKQDEYILQMKSDDEGEKAAIHTANLLRLFSHKLPNLSDQARKDLRSNNFLQSLAEYWQSPRHGKKAAFSPDGSFHSTEGLLAVQPIHDIETVSKQFHAKKGVASHRLMGGAKITKRVNREIADVVLEPVDNKKQDLTEAQINLPPDLSAMIDLGRGDATSEVSDSTVAQSQVRALDNGPMVQDRPLNTDSTPVLNPIESPPRAVMPVDSVGVGEEEPTFVRPGKDGILRIGNEQVKDAPPVKKGSTETGEKATSSYLNEKSETYKIDQGAKDGTKAGQHEDHEEDANKEQVSFADQLLADSSAFDATLSSALTATEMAKLDSGAQGAIGALRRVYRVKFHQFNGSKSAIRDMLTDTRNQLALLALNGKPSIEIGGNSIPSEHFTRNGNAAARLAVSMTERGISSLG